MRVAIIGAGLAGLSCAHILNRYASDLIVYEGSDTIHGGASGNPIGLVNPRISAFRSSESDYYTSSFALAVRKFDSIAENIDWHKCGELHLIADEKKEKRFVQSLENWNWPEENKRVVTAEDASDIASVHIPHQALYLPDSGFLDPRKLCAYYAQGIDVRLSAPVENIKDIDADIIILACGNGVKSFDETSWLPVQSVRGQITQVKETPESAKLKCNLNYGGYCTPSLNGVNTVGATFQRWLDHDDTLPEDDIENIEKLSAAVPQLAKGMQPCSSRASLRCASKDYFPIVGQVEQGSNIYVSAAHGSHGIISSLAAAHLLTDMILDRPRSQSKITINALSPQRFRDVS